MAQEFYTAKSIQLEEEKLLNELADRVDRSIIYLSTLDDEVDLDNLNRTIEREAHLDAINYISDFAFDYLKLAFMKGMFETVEYNHELFVSHTLRALESHRNDIISVAVEGDSPGNVVVTINMELLGDIQEWMDATESARAELGIGVIDNQYIELINKMWREKIYGVDREGNTIVKQAGDTDWEYFSIAPEDVENKDVVEGTAGGGGVEGKDITYRYIGKWIRTIETRLKYVSEEHAPWWYLVNHGNVSLAEAGNDRGGEPYPVFGPSNFVDNAKVAIRDAFLRYYTEAKKTSASSLLEELGDSLGNIRITGSVRNMFESLGSELANRFSNLQTRFEDFEINKIIEYVELDNQSWQLYKTSKGNLGRRFDIGKYRHEQSLARRAGR